MQGWVFVDAQGREVLARAGRGLVTAVAPDPEGGFRVEIECQRPASASRAIRYSVHGVVDDPQAALAAYESATMCAWAVEWHRRPSVPDSTGILILDLASDARGRLVSLAELGAREVVTSDDAARII